MFFAITEFVSNALEICKFNGTTAVSLGMLSTGSGPITAAWSPDGRFISMVNRGVNSIPVYSFNGRFAVLVGTASNATTNPYGVAWSPDGRFLASVSQSGGLQVFRFSGVGAPVSVATATLTSSAESRAVSWSPDGRFLAVTLYGSTTVQVYRFNGRNTLTLLSSATASSSPWGVAWSPDGRFVAMVNNGDATKSVQVFRFNGSGLVLAATAANATGLTYLAWSPDGRFLASADWSAPAGSVSIYRFDEGVNLTKIASLPAGGPFSISWSSNGRFLASVNQGSPGVVTIWRCNYYYTGQPSTTQGFSNGLLFGDKAKGVAYDADVQVLGRATVSIKGMVRDDSA